MSYEIETTIDCEMIGGLLNQDTETAINSKNIKLINNSNEFEYDYVCFNYAFGNEYIGSCREAFDILESSYELISINKAKKGDIVSYHEISDYPFRHPTYDQPCRSNVLHFALIEKTKGTLKNTIIRSKWGSDGVFKTTVYDVPDSYGNTIAIWRKK